MEKKTAFAVLGSLNATYMKCVLLSFQKHKRNIGCSTASVAGANPGSGKRKGGPTVTGRPLPRWQTFLVFLQDIRMKAKPEAIGKDGKKQTAKNTNNSCCLLPKKRTTTL